MGRWIPLWVAMVSLVLVGALPVPAWSLRNRRDKDGVETNDGRSSVKPTYLDTLNRGNEVTLQDADSGGSTTEPVTADKSAQGGIVEETIPGTIAGFRVQCFASGNIANARAEKRVLESKLGIPVYVVFIDPYYKLHVGDFRDRADAEEALARIKKLGYEGAWIVQTKIVAGR